MSPTLPPADGLTALLARCHSDPGLFNSAILRRPKLWWRQEEVARSVVLHRDTVVYSGNAVGKDYLVGTLVPWWLYTRADSLVIVTGPSQTLLGSVTWKEIRKALESCPLPTGATTTKGAKSSPQQVVLPRVGWGALGYSTTNVERASGQHNRNLFVVVEEASGVEPEVWDAVDSLKYTRLLAIGNPVRAEGRFVDLIRQADRDRLDGVSPARAVHAIRIPSTDSPHAALEQSPCGLADRTWLDAVARRYGKGSLWHNSHVEALIPAVTSELLIPEDWLTWAASQVRPQVRAGDPRAGARRVAVDLGEGVGRDRTVVLCRDELGILEVIEGNTIDLPMAASAVDRVRLRWSVVDENISYDKLGIGRGFSNDLARVGVLHARPYSGESSPRSKDFTNMRTEAGFALRTRLNPGWAPDSRHPHHVQPPFAIPAGPWRGRLFDELKAHGYELVGRQTRLTPKADVCARLGHSPDLADALIQSFAFL